MVRCVLIVFGILISSVKSQLDFPPGFKFGVASASYQVEGAWNVSDKSENIWDRFTHDHRDIISDKSDGDVACDSYHLWKRDVEMLTELGVHFYRFSISWARLLPTGFPNYVSDDGVKYYDSLINALLENDIEPVVTLYHWDMPQRLQNLGKSCYGGWTNPHIPEWFEQYAKIAFELYGDRVKTWITINEPMVICDMAYNTGFMAPGIIDSEVAPYLCSKHTLMAHAKAWRLYDKEFRHKYHGQISLANHLFWFEPASDEDTELTALVLQNCIGRYSHPIYSKEGGWPRALEKALYHNSRRQGYTKSNLPVLTKHEIEFIRGTFDFYGINHYTSRLVQKAKPGEVLGPWPVIDAPDLDARLLTSPDWMETTSSWFFVNPPGLRNLLQYLKKHYGNIPILITENGFPNKGGLEDFDRINYYEENLKQILKSINEDKVNVTGYTAWTLMDNFEWMDGYRSKFGLYEVDFSSPHRTRTPRVSAHFYKRVIEAHSLNVSLVEASQVIIRSGSSTIRPEFTAILFITLLFIFKL